jgi:hypothetical protein
MPLLPPEECPLPLEEPPVPPTAVPVPVEADRVGPELPPTVPLVGAGWLGAETALTGAVATGTLGAGLLAPLGAGLLAPLPGRYVEPLRPSPVATYVVGGAGGGGMLRGAACGTERATYVAALAGVDGRREWATVCLAAGLRAVRRVGGAGTLVTVITVGVG